VLAPLSILKGPGGYGDVEAGPGKVYGDGFADTAAGAGNESSRYIAQVLLVG